MNNLAIANIDFSSVAGLKRLCLTAFRSYPQLRLECDTRPVVLVGPNGAGKTNILEAISFLAPGRGFRQASAAEVVHRDHIGQAWAISASLWSSKGLSQLGIGLEPDALYKGREKRVIRIDGTNVRGQAALSEYLQVIWLTPVMDRLFQGPPMDRRQFLDRLVYGIDQDHARRVKAYEHATRERLRLLKEGRQDDTWLSALEDQMAREGVAMAAARARIIHLLIEQLQNACTRFPQAQMNMTGWVDDLLASGLNQSDSEEAFRNKLGENRGSDGLIGMTRVGPHRSDLSCMFADKVMAAGQCSTGEQKALLLSIVLAASRMQASQRKGVPILLLDEVVAHLDPSRRRDLFDEIEALGLQTWMTGTDFDLFAEFGERAQFFHIENSIVSAKTVV